MFREHVEAAGGQLPGLAHAVEGGGAVDLDLAGFAERRQGGVDVGHGRNLGIGARGSKLGTRNPSCPALCQASTSFLSFDKQGADGRDKPMTKKFYRPVHPRYRTRSVGLATGARNPSLSQYCNLLSLVVGIS